MHLVTRHQGLGGVGGIPGSHRTGSLPPPHRVFPFLAFLSLFLYIDISYTIRFKFGFSTTRPFFIFIFIFYLRSYSCAEIECKWAQRPPALWQDLQPPRRLPLPGGPPPGDALHPHNWGPLGGGMAGLYSWLVVLALMVWPVLWWWWWWGGGGGANLE